MAVRRIDLLQGTLDLLILKSLGTGANHGYGIALRIHQLSDDVLRVEEGSLYPALYRMEEQGLVTRLPCVEDARGVNCTMTEKGWQVLVAAAPKHVQSVRDHLVDVLTPEQFAALGDAMETVRLHLTGGACHVE